MLWKDEEIQYLRDNYSKEEKDIICRNLKRNWPAIIRMANLHDLKRHGIYSKAKMASNLLLETPEAYYWAGFLMADAHISENHIDLAINTLDKDHLESYADFVGYVNNLKFRKTNNVYRVDFSDRGIVPLFRKKFNLSNKGAKTYNPPSINIKNDDLFLAFFCGFVDGDGNIHHKIDNKKGGIRESCSLFIQCHGSWKDTLESWCKRVSMVLKREDYIKKCKISKRNHAYIYLQDMNFLISLKNELIRIELDTIYLKRKWDNIDSNYSNKQFRLAGEKTEKVLLMFKNGDTKQDIAKELGITEIHVRHILKSNDIKYERSKFKQKKWSEKEIDLLKENYVGSKDREICELINDRSYESIAKKASQIGLRKYG